MMLLQICSPSAVRHINIDIQIDLIILTCIIADQAYGQVLFKFANSYTLANHVPFTIGVLFDEDEATSGAAGAVATDEYETFPGAITGFCLRARET